MGGSTLQPKSEAPFTGGTLALSLFIVSCSAMLPT